MQRNYIRLSSAAMAATLLTLFAACGAGGGSGQASEEFDDPTMVGPEETWTVPATAVNCEDPNTDPAGCYGEYDDLEFTSLSADDVEQEWNLCFSGVHVQDPFWVSVNYAAITEAERLGVNLEWHDAGGYTEITTQVEQIENCITSGVDAIIVGAASQDALTPVVEQAVANDIVVIDTVNGLTSSEVHARAIGEYQTLGLLLAEQLTAADDVESIAVVPGPSGVAWSEGTLEGLQEGLEGSGIEIATIEYGETAREVQLGLVEDTITAHPDIDVLVGTAMAMDVGSTVLAERGLEEDIDLYSTYVNPDTLELIEAGRVQCAPTENQVITVRMAVNLAIMQLQGGQLPNEQYRRYGAYPAMVCQEAFGEAVAIEQFERGTSVAPEGWTPQSGTTVD